MIIYNLQFPENPTSDIFAGVLGDNNCITKVFFIKNISDENYSFIIRLRFKDGKINSVIPDDVKVTNEGTYIYWKIKKNDIFCCGSFELQIECSNGDSIMQTQSIRLFADESLAVGNAEYENPNSATLAIRNQIIELLAELKNQNNKITQNIEIINNSDINQKENISNKVSDISQISNESQQYPNLEFLKEYYYNANQTEQKLSQKADVSNVYSKTETDNNFLKNESGSVQGTNIAKGAISSIKLAERAVSTSNLADNSITKSKLNANLIAEFNNKADKANTLGEYGITNAYTMDQIDMFLNEKQDRVSPNLFDKKQIIEGYKIDLDGNIVEQSDYFISNLIKVKNKNMLRLTIDSSDIITSEVQFFDIFQHPVWSDNEQKTIEIFNDRKGNQFVRVPETAYYVRLSISKDFLQSEIMLSDKILPYVDFEESVDSTLTISKMPADAEIVGNILNSKYNSSNVETGKGDFNISVGLAEYGSFEYTKIEDVVVISMKLTINPRTGNYTTATFTNPPYCIKSSVYSTLVEEYTASKSSTCWSANSTMIKVSVPATITEQTQLTGIFVYKTNE